MRSVRTQPDEFNPPRSLRGHFTAFAIVLAALLAVSGCARSLVRGPGSTAIAQPLAQLDLPAGDAGTRAAALRIAGEFALQNNDVAGAARDYAEAAQISNDPAIARRAVQLALVDHDAAGVVALLPRWQALGADPRELADARAQLAMLHGDRAEAERQFRILLANGSVDAWKTFAADLLSARDTALAGRILEDIANPNGPIPADARLWVTLSQLAEHLGRHALANRLAEEAVDRFGSPDSVQWAASLKMESGDGAGAEALYAKGIAAHPRDVDLRIGYATLLGSLGKDAEALKVLSRGPQTAATWSARVGFAARAEDEPALRRLYQELQQAPPSERVDSEFLLGQLAELLEHDRQALAWYGQVDPGSRYAFDAQVRSAVLLDKTGQSEQAHALAMRLQQDYADDPDSLRTAFELGAQLYARHGDHARAIAVYDRGLKALPDDPALVYDRGIEYANAGNTDAALADFRTVLKLDPSNVEAMNALGFTLADADRDLPEATELLRKALAEKPDAVAIMDSWGWLQYRLGDLEQARDWLQRAWSKQQDPDIGAHLGEVLWKLGQQQHAREVFARVRKLDPGNPALQRAERALRP